MKDTNDLPEHQTVIVEVVLAVQVRSGWGDDCTLGQLRRQAVSISCASPRNIRSAARRLHAANARIIADRAGRRERYSKGYPQEKGP